jgi:hypothetical protein
MLDPPMSPPTRTMDDPTVEPSPKFPALPEFWVLHVFQMDGGFIGFYTHPNKEWCEEKMKEMKSEFHGSVYMLQRYAPGPSGVRQV